MKNLERQKIIVYETLIKELYLELKEIQPEIVPVLEIEDLMDETIDKIKKLVKPNN